MSAKVSREQLGRLNAVGVGVAVCLATAAASQGYKQVIARDSILAKDAQLTARKALAAASLSRGSIYSSDGKVLAQSDDTYQLTLLYRKLPKSPGFYASLASVSGIPEPELRRASLEPPADPQSPWKAVWQKYLSRSQRDQIESVKKTWQADGVSLDPVLSRVYPLSEASAELVGSVHDGRPVSGLEQSLDTILGGKGSLKADIGGMTPALARKIEEENTTGEAGRTVQLTIDSKLQTLASDAVRRGVEKANAKAGSAVVIDPKTGDVLAMADWPSYDPRTSPKDGADFFSASMATLEPGSTFKLFTLGLGLETGQVDPDRPAVSTSILSLGGGMAVRNHDSKAYGMITPEKAIAVSCNTTAARWALEIGRTRYIKFLDQLGVLQKPHVGLPSEAVGQFNRKDGGRIIQLANLGFGQAINVSPLSLAGAFGLFANHGELMAPRLIRNIGGIEVPPVSRGRILSAASADLVLRYSESVIEESYGTGHSLRVPGLRLAGKTGTAQKVGRDGKVGSGGHVANFVGFVPAQNPQYVVLVMIDQPKGPEYYGGAVAGPVFRDIVKGMLDLQRVRPSRTSESEGRYNPKQNAEPPLTAARD